MTKKKSKGRKGKQPVSTQAAASTSKAPEAEGATGDAENQGHAEEHDKTCSEAGAMFALPLKHEKTQEVLPPKEGKGKKGKGKKKQLPKAAEEVVEQQTPKLGEESGEKGKEEEKESLKEESEEKAAGMVPSPVEKSAKQGAIPKHIKAKPAEMPAGPIPMRPISGGMGDTIGQLHHLSVMEYKPPRRPDEGGTEGKKLGSELTIFQLNFQKMDFGSIMTSVYCQMYLKKSAEVFTKLVETQSHLFEKVKPVFDGAKNMFTADTLPIRNGKAEVQITLQTDGERDRQRTFKVTVKLVSQINLQELARALNGEPCIMPYVTLQALDIVFRHLPLMNSISVGRCFFKPPEVNSRNDLGAGREVWFGYYQSVRPAQWRPMLNVDTSATAFYKSMDCLDFMCEVLSIDDLSGQNRPLADSMRVKFGKEIKNLKIQATHMGMIKRKYKVNGVTRHPAHTQTFPLDIEGGGTEQCTVAKYFRRQYNMHLKYPHMPCLHVGNPNRNVYLPVEVCRILEGQKCTKKLTDQQTANMIRKTAKPAPEREKEINKLVEAAGFDTDPFLQEFNISVDCRMVDVEGRVLPAPRLGYKEQKNVQPRDGVWDMRGKQFHTGKEINNWSIVHFNPRLNKDRGPIENFISTLQRMAGESGMPIKKKPISIKYLTASSDIGPHFAILQRQHNVEFILVVLRGKCPEYAEVKKVADTQLGLVTQCIQEKNLFKCAPATVSNLCLKINAKLGGTNNIIVQEIQCRVFKKPVIVLGADVTHPAPMEKKPSVAAIVGSLDRNATRYAAEVRVQESKKEIIEEMCSMTKDLLVKFYQSTNKKKPEALIFYRDGVSEGQFMQVLQYELKAVRQACAKLEKDYKPPVTFIVVQKRHHTRLFAADMRDQVGKSKNVPPGTTVDKKIIHPCEFDFFLCSHFGIQGTSRPAKYHVLWDENDFSSDELQKLTYQLCHIYVRCTRSVSIPAPAYYAHLVAFRARSHIADKDYSSGGSAVTAGKETLIPLMELGKSVKVHRDMDKGMYFA